MPYKLFDTSRLQLKPLTERVHDVKISVNTEVEPLQEDIRDSEDILAVANAIKLAKKEKATVLMMYGAHVIRTGNSPGMIRLMKEGYVTHFATNGAGSIHDFELAMIGETCESVARYISEGQFGLWKETGLLNEAVVIGDKEGLGFGEAVGKYIWENDFKFKEQSVLAMAYHFGIPATVHVGIGNDIVHEHPNFDPAATGRATYRDFLIYAESVLNLQNGVFLNFGSAVTGPEVYLKALAMARNVAKQENKNINRLTTAVFDVLPLEGNTKKEPEKTNPQYYFRPWKTILARTVANGGQSYYICGKHQQTIPALVNILLEREK
ncbi:MAG: hypothetical protein K6G26_11035 [Lachnospiraceae bacterium]|nr:hypothetical protein [Lachnospiraceae bacterium]